MKRILLLSLLFCLFTIAKAQKVYFIYLQSENAAPFYVRIGDKVISSSAEGYLILSKLTDSTYSFTVGQPGKRNEGQFSITINKADRGFLIKEQEGGLSLFDLQTFSIYKSIASASTTKTIRRDDRFTALLAKATNDSTLLVQAVMVEPQKPAEVKQESVVIKEDPAPINESTTSITEPMPPANTVKTELVKESIGEIAAKPEDTAAISNTNQSDTASTIAPPQTTPGVPPATNSVEKAPATPVQKEEEKMNKKDEKPVEIKEEYIKSTVVKKAESSLSGGFSLVYVVAHGTEVDTVWLTIPNPAIPFADTATKGAETKQFLDISAEPAPEKAEPKVGAVKQTEPEKPKQRCAVLAADDDFFKLRRDMAAEKDDDGMIRQAKKYFKNRCFRTEHIKYLSTLFLTDAGKYQFFDTAYFHVYDQDKFETLQAEIKDSYYLNRFKALVAK